MYKLMNRKEKAKHSRPHGRSRASKDGPPAPAAKRLRYDKETGRREWR